MKLLVLVFVATISVDKLSCVSGIRTMDLTQTIIASDVITGPSGSPETQELNRMKSKLMILFAKTEDLGIVKWANVLETKGPNDELQKLNSEIKTSLVKISWTHIALNNPSLKTVSLKRANNFIDSYEQRLTLRNDLYRGLLADFGEVQTSKSEYDAATDKRAKGAQYANSLKAVEAKLKKIHETRSEWVKLLTE